MLEPHEKEIIDLYFEQEVLLAKLYKMFAVKFADYKTFDYQAFWLDMAKDEQEHAKWIKQLYYAEKKELVIFDEGRVKTYALKAFIEHIENIIAEVESNHITLIRAAVYTLDLERALIEKDVFKHFEALSNTLSGTMKRLEKATRMHLKKAEDMVANLRK